MWCIEAGFGASWAMVPIPGFGGGDARLTLMPLPFRNGGVRL